MCYIFKAYRYRCGCSMTPEAVKEARVEACPAAIQAEWSTTKAPCDWQVHLTFDYADCRMCYKHEMHWEAYYGSCWSLELRMLKARAKGIKDPFKVVIIEDAELRAEQIWHDYAQTKDYDATKERFEEGLSKTEELLHRLEIREQLGWPQNGMIDLNPAAQTVEAAGHGNAQTSHERVKEQPRNSVVRRNSL